MTPAEEHANRAIWDRLPVDMRAGRMILYIALAAGVRFDLRRPILDFNTPPCLPKPLSRALTLYVFLNAKAIAGLLEAEARR
jgi:hypothetical protein